MQVKLVSQNIGSVKTNKQQAENIKAPRRNAPNTTGVSFTGAPNVVVGLMDFIAAGGFAASFCIQDGLGFIAPRVYKGLKRGGKKKYDENGNEILDKNGNPKRELNWAYARKEGIREIITGPSAFFIPWLLLKGINKKFGRGNSVKLDYIDGFKNIFTDYAKNNKGAILEGKADKKDFYKSVFKEIIDTTINGNPKALKINNIDDIAKEWADKQSRIDDIIAEHNKKGFFSRMLPNNIKLRNEKLAAEGSVEDLFMELKKQHVGGISDHAGISIKASNYSAENKNIKHGSMGKLTEAMSNYYDDAVKNIHNKLKTAKDANIEDLMKTFTGKKLGSRILTNIGLFLAVAMFYTQIPKLYNMGTGGKNPALMNDEESPSKVSKGIIHKKEKVNDKNGKNVSFGSGASALEKFGNQVFDSKILKKISDIFELNGPIIQGQAMSVLLYGACIPPRLIHAQDKYDFSEIVVRDMTAFTALLFGAKALSRLFSDGFTKVTGLALNSKDIKGRNIFQKTWDYLNPANTRHAVLSSKTLESKYLDIHNYKDGINGFVEFIEKSGGDIKKALSLDKDVKSVTEEILKEIKHKSFADATSKDIKTALRLAKERKSPLIDKFYGQFYNNIKEFNGGISGYIEFIEQSGKNVKDTLAKNKELKAVTEEILKKVTNNDSKTFAQATNEEIKNALIKAKESMPELVEKFSGKYHNKNKLLTYAKTCNSAFDFLSTLILVPGLIIWLTDVCKKMTDKKKAEEARIKNQIQAQQAPLNPSSKPTMQGFLHENAA